MAMYSICESRRMPARGTKPAPTAARSGRESHISMANDPAMARMSPTTSAST